MNVYLVPCIMLNDSHVLSHVILTITPFQALAICELCPLMIQLDNCIQLENQDSDSSDSKATYLIVRLHQHICGVMSIRYWGRFVERERIHRRKVLFCHVEFSIRASREMPWKSAAFQVKWLKQKDRRSGWCVSSLWACCVAWHGTRMLVLGERFWTFRYTCYDGAWFRWHIYLLFDHVVHCCFIPDVFRNLTIGSIAKSVVMVMN